MKIILPFLICLYVATAANAQTFHLNGISTNQLTEEIFRKYDANKNGVIEVYEESFLRTKLDHNVIKSESRGLLFINADRAGNNDRICTKLELLKYIETFDEDNNGEITSYKNIFYSWFGGKSEWRKFQDKYAEGFKYEKQ